MQRIWICMAIPKGAFAYEPSLGSRLREAADPVEALEAAREALKEIPEAEPLKAEMLEEVWRIKVQIPEGIRRIEIGR